MPCAMCLNPFMNQVYFYDPDPDPDPDPADQRLNPFMNQVYFYMNGVHTNRVLLGTGS